MVEGEEREDAAVGGHGVDLFVGDEVAADVAVGEHDTLGVASGARGIDKRHPVVGLDGVFEVGDDRAVFLAAGNTGFEDFEGAGVTFDRSEGVDFGLLLHFLNCREDALEEDVVADQNIFGFAVGEDVEVVVGAEGGIDWHMDHACKGKSHVDEIPFRAVGGDGYHFVAWLEPQFEEAAGHVVGIFIIVVGAVFYPFSFFFTCQDVGLVGEVGDKVVEQVEGTCYFHIAII